MPVRTRSHIVRRRSGALVRCAARKQPFAHVTDRLAVFSNTMALHKWFLGQRRYKVETPHHWRWFLYVERSSYTRPPPDLPSSIDWVHPRPPRPVGLAGRLALLPGNGRVAQTNPYRGL